MTPILRTKFNLGLFCSALLLLTILLPSKAFALAPQLLNVNVTDGISNSPLSNQAVGILRREADGSLKGIRTVSTDANGQLSLDLPGLAADSVYVLRTAMKYGNRLAYSSDLNQTGNFTFKAGNVRVKALNGQTGVVLSDYRVNAYIRMADGTDVYVSNSGTITDASGFADFDLPELGSGKTYVFKAQNPFDSSWKTSPLISQAGLINFVIGNQLLNVTVTDGIGNTPLANQAVNVLQRQVDGSLKGIRSVTTDVNGQLSLDLPGLGVDSVYVLRTAMKHGNQLAYSPDINHTGDFAFKAGNVRVKALNGQTGVVLSDYRVNAYTRMADGTEVYVSNSGANTDASGFADFDLPELGSGKTYVFKTQNPFDNHWKTSAVVTQAGLINFVVGNQLLNVTVTDGISHTRLANQAIGILSREADGSLKGIRTANTDANGQLSLDLPGLGVDSVYVLRTAMKHGNRLAYSSDLNQTGNFAFKAGNVRVKALNGQSGAVLSDYRINAYTLMADGTEVYVSNSGANTDASGFADFDLPELGSGKSYVLKAQNPFDSSWKTSAVVTQAGLLNFVIGNQLLNVTVTDGISHTPLANQAIGILSREADGSLKGIRTANTDVNGQLSLDLPGLGVDTVYVLRTAMKHGNQLAYSRNINQTGNFAFKAGNVRVKALNGQSGAVLSDYRVNAYTRMADGAEVYVSNSGTTTDAAGFADFDLPELGSGKTYVFKAQNPFDSSWKTSQLVTQAGLINFVVGNRLLKVTLTNGISNTPLTNQSVNVLQRQVDGSLKGIRTATTDANGQLSLDLPGLGTDSVYVLRTQQLFGSGTVFSDDISQTGDMAFRVGNVLVKVIDGANDQAIAGQDITVMEELVDGSLLWFARVPTDQNGNIPLHLPKLGQGRKYLLKAQTKLDNRWVNSSLIVNTGTFEFTVGNKLLNVQMQNALDANALANIEVTAYERLPDQTLRWFQRKTTDTQGQINFDLTGLGSGSSYVLRTNPYGTTIETKDIDKTGPFQLLAGSVAVKLHKAKTGELMPGQSLILYEKGPTGNLIWRKSLLTDTAGVVRFDPIGLGDGRLFVVRANNLFGNSKNHYSPWFASKGWIDFAVDPEDPDKLDDKPPVFVSFIPANNANVASQGFQLQMKVTDNQQVAKVELTVSDPVAGTFNAAANLVKGDWRFTVAKEMVTAGKLVTVTAVAYDKVGNHASLSRKFKIIKDIKPPEISVSSHQTGDQIDEHGFALFGSVSDETPVKTLLVTVTDPIRGVIEKNRELEIGVNGHWGLAVSQLSRGQSVSVDLSAEDWAGNHSEKQLVLPVMTEPVSAAQLLNRITFGATPELIKELRSLGAEAFIQQQLQPNLINDTAFEAYLAGVLEPETNDMIKLQHTQIARASYSKRQLLEVMTWFWENHFNTDRSKTGNDFELAENNAFRDHALGRFRDLLDASAKSPAMLLFLDNHQSQKLAPNENYARELMELHTLGVDNGYTTKDIAEVARVFTGWRVANRLFDFAPWRHDDGEKIVLGQTIPAGSGVMGGEQVLDILASHPGTARHICSKLLMLLVTDQPVETSVTSCANDFIANADEDNQIAQVLEGIISSPAFSDSTNFHNKVKIPLEFVSGLFRQLPVTVNYGNTRNLLKGLDMHLFYFSEPTGWPEQADRWVSSGQLTQRWQFAGQAVTNRPSIYRNYWELPAQFFIDKGIETSEGVLAFLFELSLSHDYTAMEYAAAQALLTANNSENFDIHAIDADAKLRKVIALILSSPAYQLQ